MTTLLPYHDKDLGQMPPPKVLQEIDYEQLLSDRTDALNGFHPLLIENDQPVLKQAELIQTGTETYWKVPFDSEAGLYYIDLESDPSARHLQADVYREQLFRHRVNEAALATMPAYATGTDLDHIGTRLEYAVHRLTITPATDKAPAVLETDDAYRKRILMSVEGNARGGSKGWYLYNTLSASGLVKDAYCNSPSPYRMDIVVLSHEGNGAATQALLDEVKNHVTSRYKFPQGDVVTVMAADVIEYELTVDLHFYQEAQTELVEQAIRKEWLNFRKQSERIGHWITQSGVDAALHQTGVYRAVVSAPTLPLEISKQQAPYCLGLTLNRVIS